MVLLLGLACSTGTVSLGTNDTGAASADTGPEDLPGWEDTAAFGCGPSAADVEVDELERVELQFRCSEGATPSQWLLLSGPVGATLDEATGTLTWNTDLASAGEWPVEVEAIQGDQHERGQATIWVADALNEAGNVEPDPLTYTYEYGIPVFHLSVRGALPESGSASVAVTYRGHEFVGTEAQYRGAASSYYPKRSYRVNFAPDDEFKDSAEHFPKRRSIVLTSLFDDNAYFRQKMCFDIWNRISPSRPIATSFTVLYLNGGYVGLYLLGDHIDGEWFEDQGYPEDGNLYKSVDHSANFYSTYGGAKSSWHSGYEKKEGTEGDWADLDALVEFVATSADSAFDARIAELIDVEDVYDWWALVLFTEADDSGGKNAYFYNDPAAPLFRYEPWDFNHSLGQTWRTEREPANYAYDFSDSNGLFARLLDSDVYGDVIRQRFADARANELSKPEMQALIDSYIARIDRSARRDWDVWSRQYQSYSGWSWRDDWTDYDEEVAYVRDWIDERWEWIEAWNP
jgi:spore coat protein H